MSRTYGKWEPGYTDGSIALQWWPQQSKCKDTMLHGNEWTDGELNAAWAMSDPILEES